VSKTKRQLRRALKRCRRELAAAERSIAEGGVCMPVPSWRDAEEVPGIRYATEPDGPTARERMAEEAAAEWRERAKTEQTARMAMEGRLRDAERHLEHHHANGPFTLVVNADHQLHMEVRRLRAKLDEAEAKLATPPGYHTLHVGERIEVFVPGKGGAEAELYEIDGWEHHKGDVTLHAFGVGGLSSLDDA
jgi:hypothetical protein